MTLIPQLIRTSFFIFLSTSLLTACGTISEFKEFRQTGDTIYLKGTIEDIRESAITAMANVRLTSPEIESYMDGIVVYAEQSAIAGMIFNSYGGYGKVTVVPNPSLGQGTYSVSAITRSKAVMEPVGNQDAFKGWNYNNPVVARQILEQIKGLVNAKALN